MYHKLLWVWLICTRVYTMAEPKQRKSCNITYFFSVVSESCSSTTQSRANLETEEESTSQVSTTSSTIPQTHHVSGFDSNWMVEFSWLLNVAGEGMFCLLCQKYKHIVCSRRGAWITTSCISYRRDKVVQHAASTYMYHYNYISCIICTSY